MRVKQVLDHFWVRITLSLCILVSLIPREAGATIDTILLAVFGVELLARVYVLGSRPRVARDAQAQRRRIGDVLFLVVDVVALLSFLPWKPGPDGARWLRLFRLTRMLLLVGYWSPVVRDLWWVTARRERSRQLGLLALIVLFLSFSGAAVLSTLAADGIDFSGDGIVGASDGEFGTLLWWSFRQLEDPGNLLQAPISAAGLVVSLGLTLAGLLLVSFLIGLAGDVVNELMDLSRNRPVGMKRHTVIINLTPGVPLLLSELARHYSKLFRPTYYAVVGTDRDPPAALRAPELPRVAYRHFTEGSSEFIERADVAAARRIVILAGEGAPYPDAQTASTVLSVREANRDAWVVAEVVEQSNQPTVRVAGGDRTIVVATERMLAHYVVTAIHHPERLDFIDTLWRRSEGDEINTYFFNFDRGEASQGATLRLEEPLAFDHLYQAGLSCDAFGLTPVAPIGAMISPDNDPDPASAVPWFAASYGSIIPAGTLHGLITVAPNFSAAKAFASSITAVISGGADALGPLDLGPPTEPDFADRTRPATPSRLLCIGYRPAVVDLLAILMATNPHLEVAILLDESQRALAMTALSDHGVDVQAGLSPETDDWGVFTEDRGVFHYTPRGGARSSGTARVFACAWGSERVLLNLPTGDHVGDWDHVVLLGGEGAAQDARTSLTALKIADLIRAQRERFVDNFRVLAAVSNDDLKRRLAAGFSRATRDKPPIAIVSHQTVRALVTSQAVSVVGFEAIFSELLGPWGESLVRVEPEPSWRANQRSTWDFVTLAMSLRRSGWTLVAVDVASPGGQQERLFARDKRTFSPPALIAAWVVVHDGPHT